MQFNQLNRRGLIGLLSGAAVTWPLAARAQQGKVARVGFLSQAGPSHAWARVPRGGEQASGHLVLPAIRRRGGLMSYGPDIPDIFLGLLVRWPNSPRREACRPAAPAADQVRASHKPEVSEDAGPECSRRARPGRWWGDWV